jgi:hypothetical protein
MKRANDGSRRVTTGLRAARGRDLDERTEIEFDHAALDREVASQELQALMSIQT